MRHATLAVAIVVLAACGSSQPRFLAVQVFEARARAVGRTNSVSTAEGSHVFRVRATNQSTETVYIESISLESFSNEMQFRNRDLAVNQILEPGQTEDFEVLVDVSLVPYSHIYQIDTVDVVITLHTNTQKAFTEKSNQSVKGE